MNRGNDAIQACVVHTIPTDMDAEVLVEGRTGAVAFDTNTRCEMTEADRFIREEVNTFLHNEKSRHVAQADCHVRPDEFVSTKHAPVEHTLGGNEEYIGCNVAEQPCRIHRQQRDVVTCRGRENDVVTKLRCTRTKNVTMRS